MIVCPVCQTLPQEYTLGLMCECGKLVFEADHSVPNFQQGQWRFYVEDVDVCFHVYEEGMRSVPLFTFPESIASVYLQRLVDLAHVEFVMTS